MSEGCLVDLDGIEVLKFKIPDDIEVVKVSLRYTVLTLNKEYIKFHNDNWFAMFTISLNLIIISLESFKLFNW